MDSKRGISVGGRRAEIFAAAPAEYAEGAGERGAEAAGGQRSGRRDPPGATAARRRGVSALPAHRLQLLGNRAVTVRLALVWC